MPRMLRVLFSFFLLSAVLLGEEFPENQLTLEELRADLVYLASDELAGRRTGTVGNDLAAAYIAKQFELAGLTRPSGLEGFLQKVLFRLTEAAAAGTVEILDEAFSEGDNLITLRGTRLEIETDGILIAGNPDQWSPLQGNVAFASLGQTQGIRAFRSALAAGRERLAKASSLGARALVEVYQGPAWGRLSGFLSRTTLSLASDAPDDGSGIPHVLVHDPEGTLLSRLTDVRSSQVSVRLAGRRTDDVVSSNVIGIIEGSSPELRWEHILLLAHYDHVGAGLDIPSATPEDSIFNGARDNGMGTVAIIAAARILARTPPQRSVIVMAVTGEEQGLLGSRHYARNPAVPLANTVFALNVDTGGYTDTGVVTVVGLERTTAREDIIAGASDFGLEAIQDPAPSQNLFSRSDNFNLARLGLPAPTFSPGYRAFDSELLKYYHQPGDEADENFDFDYLLTFCRAYVRTARRIADNPIRPRWVEGDEFEATWKRLYERDGKPADQNE